jgi:hypothetical protein
MSDKKSRDTTQQLIRRCFCPETKKLSNFNIQLYALVHSRKDVLHLARAARRFVRMENKQKRYNRSICRKCVEIGKHYGCQNGTSGVIYCGHFKATACRKARRAG